MTQRMYCDDAPVSYEATPADLAPKARASAGTFAAGQVSAARAPVVGERRMCDDSPVSYVVTEADVRGSAAQNAQR